MATLSGLHVDQQQLSAQQIGAACNSAALNLGRYNFLTNSSTAAADTNAGLQTAVLAAACHADESYAKPRINLGITLGLYSGELSNARILGLTTTTELVQLTFARVGVNGAQLPE